MMILPFIQMKDETQCKEKEAPIYLLEALVSLCIEHSGKSMSEPPM